MKHLIIALSITIMFISCHKHSPEEKMIKATLNKELILEMFDSVQLKSNKISFNAFRHQHKYISVVYLKYGCNTCYNTFIKWHNMMDSIKTPDNYTVLFIIKGKSYTEFMAKVLEVDSVDNHYHVIMDSCSQYLNNNNDIPFEMLYNSVLIDNNNKIKLIGPPYSSLQMKNLFNKIISE